MEAIVPIAVLVAALLLGQGFAKSARAGFTVAIGLLGIRLVVLLLCNVVGPSAVGFAATLGVKLDVLDVGWPTAAGMSFASPIAAIVVPVVIALNLAMVAARVTRTLDVDLWNYWHFIYGAALVRAATGSTLLGVLSACVTVVVVLKLADWTAPIVDKELGLPGISLPHTESVNWAPLMFALDRITRHVFRGKDLDAAKLRARLGVLGEPLVIGGGIGAILGALGGLRAAKEHDWLTWSRVTLTAAVTTAAVLVILPKVVAILMEGLIPVAEGARDFMTKRFPDRDLLIGLDSAVIVGQPHVMAIALACVPICMVLALVLPGVHMLPLADLTALPFYIVWGVIAARGHVGRGLVHAIVIVIVILYVGTSLAPLTTEIALERGYRDAYTMPAWSGLAVGSHLIPWILVMLSRPGQPSFFVGVGAAIVYAGAWAWVRKDLRARANASP
ncbi:MAG: system Galactitol-specific component [Myxococcaceae bacterium]|nr:system Galactitol-specific component [Myxococcaceae bacterium]